MPTDASAGWTNSFFVCCFWALLSAWWRGVEMRQWATAHLPVRLLLEGFLCELLFAVVFLLFAYLSAGGARRSILAQGAGAVLLLFGPIYWVRFSGGRTWPFLTRLALCMQAAVVALKFNSLVATRRALEAAAAPAAEALEPAPAAREGGEIGGRAWARAPPAQPGAARGAWGIVRFLFSPALVYEPRPALFLSFSPSVFAEKLALIAALAVLAVFLHERTLADVWARAGERDVVTSFFEAVLPLHALSILLFFSTFVGVIGASAEITGYADRFAYSEWWSSTTFAEFARRWNKPVGDWLRASIYDAAGPGLCGLVCVYAFSIILHELLLWAALGPAWKTPWLSIMSAMQLPLMPLLRVSGAKNTRAGNLFFWAGLSTGLAVNAVLYARDARLSDAVSPT